MELELQLNDIIDYVDIYDNVCDNVDDIDYECPYKYINHIDLV